MKLSITRGKCVSESVCARRAGVCVCVRRRQSGRRRVCVFYQTLLAFELLAAASDSVSSSAFIRSASHCCHLSFPCAYIIHTRTHYCRRAHTPAAIGSPRSTGTFWLVSRSLFRVGKRACRVTFHLKSQSQDAKCVGAN